MAHETQPKPFFERPDTLRFDGIDLLRGFSIIAVILLHGQIRMYGYSAWIRAMRSNWLFDIFFWNGDNGVTVFFSISGFLITLTSLRRFGSLAKMRAAAFYRIRFARIAPLLFLLLAVLSVLDLNHANGFQIQPSCATLPRALLAALTFHVNWLEATHGYLPANWDVLWSLSVEEMFYLFFPLACLLLLRWRRELPEFVLLLLIFVGMGPFARTVWATNEIWQGTSYLGGMSGIALGCLTALLTDHLQPTNPLRMYGRALLIIQVAGSLLMLLIIIRPHWLWVEFLGRSGTDDTVLSLGTCMVMLTTVFRGRIGSVWSSPIRWFGRHSYEVYLTHEFVVVWMTTIYAKVRQGSPLLWIAAELALAAPLGALVARWFSEPMNRLLRGAAPPSHHS
ncbi:MAG: acyltransferase [Terracidiphilus sp.]|jgi:peptidoglycan/LPS O-acetylase OafA/YrhL